MPESHHYTDGFGSTGSVDFPAVHVVDNVEEAFSTDMSPVTGRAGVQSENHFLH